MALFYSGATLAGAFGSVLAYAITLMDGVGGLSGWRYVHHPVSEGTRIAVASTLLSCSRWIFILEGIPTILLGVATWFCTFIIINSIQTWEGQRI